MSVAVGDALPRWTMDSVTPERMRTVAAILRDPNPIHWDREATRALGLEGRLINQSPTNLGYVVNMLIAFAGPTCVRRLRVGFPRPVFDGDRVEAGGVVRALTRDGGVDVAECEVWLDREDGSRAIEGTAWVTLPRR